VLTFGSQENSAANLIKARKLRAVFLATECQHDLAATENIGRMNFGLQRSLKAKL
jgi:hypothetical protein